MDFVIWTWFVIWVLAFELLSVTCLHASVRQPSRLAKIKGKPTKRIMCILRVKCVGGNRLTYEKELLNSRKNGSFYKTNHSSFPPSLPPYDRHPNDNISCIYARNDKGKLLSNTQFPPALRSVICLFEARCRAKSTCLVSVQSVIISGD